MVEFLPSATCLRQLRVPLVFLCSLTVVVGLPTNHGNITVPDGTTNHGDPNLICTPTTWIDIFIFYFGNYFAHALTVPAYPGESGVDLMVNVILAVLFPTAGVIRGVDAIIRHAAWVGDGQLQKAARAGALRMVVRSDDWRPVAGDHIRGAAFERPSTTERNEIIVSSYSPDWLLKDGWKYWPSLHSSDISFRARKMHGRHKLPKGYSFATVPRDTLVLDAGIDQSLTTEPLETGVCSVFNFPQVSAALVQSIYATVTLYNSRGDQINRYGYAAFSLTVAPYVLMSAINLLGGLLTPTYPTVYLVGSSIMDEARSRGASFNGAIGQISDTHADPTNTPEQISLIVEGTFEDRDGGLFFSRTGKSSGAGEASAGGQPFEVIEARASLGREHWVLHIPSCPEFQRIGSIYHAPPAPSVAHSELRPPVAMDTESSSGRGAVDQSLAALAQYSHAQHSRAMFICVVFGSIPIAIVGGLSGFHPGESTKAQRVWATAWLVIGVYAGVGTIVLRIAAMVQQDMRELGLFRNVDDLAPKNENMSRLVTLFLLCGPLAVGGFVVVGKMLLEYGSCVGLS